MPDAGVPDEVREAIEEERQLAELHSRVERSWVLRLEGFLGRRSPGVVVIVGLLVLTLIGLADAASGEFAVEVLYLVPIGFVAFGRGRSMGLLAAAVATAAWAAVEVFQGVTLLDSSVTYWNALGRFGEFAAVVLLIAPMREAMELQTQLAEREAQAAEQLRAMEELREAALASGVEDEVDATTSEEPPEEGTVVPVTETITDLSRPEVLEDADVEERLLDALSDLERDARRERTTGDA
jgi:K+-sensing histidine kinase KdpD